MNEMNSEINVKEMLRRFEQLKEGNKSINFMGDELKQLIDLADGDHFELLCLCLNYGFAKGFEAATAQKK